MLSVSSCRTSRPRPAPSATRTANSLRREIVRESSAPARFAHVMSSTSPALARSTSSGVRVSPTIASRSGSWADPEWSVVLRIDLREAVQIDARSCVAVSYDHAGLEPSDEPEIVRAAHRDRIAHAATGATLRDRNRRCPSGGTKSRGSTPTTVRVIPLIWNDFPDDRSGRRRTAAATCRTESIAHDTSCRAARLRRESCGPNAGDDAERGEEAPAATHASA